MSRVGSAPLPRIGAHISAAGDLGAVLTRARRIGAEAVQLFPSNPRQWAGLRHPDAEIRALGADLRRSSLPLFVHSIYLINLASSDPAIRQKSAAALGDALRFAGLAGAQGVVTHVGSHRGHGFVAARGRVVQTVREARARAGPGLPPLLLEGSSGAGNSVGRDLYELAELLGRLPEPVGLCLDTAHLFAAGVPIDTAEGLETFLREVGESTGLDRIGVIHLNDSRSAFASRSDRHENLWEGAIGRSGLAPWLSHPELRQVPFVLEVPGFDGRGPDRKNILRARRMRDVGLRPK